MAPLSNGKRVPGRGFLRFFTTVHMTISLKTFLTLTESAVERRYTNIRLHYIHDISWIAKAIAAGSLVKLVTTRLDK